MVYQNKKRKDDRISIAFLLSLDLRDYPLKKEFIPFGVQANGLDLSRI